jgi:hypothetical protein
MEEVAIGIVERYFGKIGTAIKITSGELKVGDKIPSRVTGRTSSSRWSPCSLSTRTFRLQAWVRMSVSR